MTGIKPELIEKASRLTDWTQHEYRVFPDDWIPYCICGWRAEEPYDVPAYDRHITETVLATVADDLRTEGAVKALRDAERDLTTPRFISSENREPLATRMSSTDVADWLTRRAGRIEARDE